MGRAESVRQIKAARAEFAGVGTRKAKLALNKLAAHSPAYQALELDFFERRNFPAKPSTSNVQEKMWSR